MLILVNKKDKEIGRDRAFMVMIFNLQGDLLLARRSQQKPLWPKVWDGSIASHPVLGETLGQAVRRRLKEEVGINDSSTLKKLFKFQYEAYWKNEGIEKEICATYKLIYEGKLKVDPREIDGLRWISLERLKKELKNFPEKYSPWLILALKEIDKKDSSS